MPISAPASLVNVAAMSTVVQSSSFMTTFQSTFVSSSGGRSLVITGVTVTNQTPTSRPSSAPVGSPTASAPSPSPTKAPSSAPVVAIAAGAGGGGLVLIGVAAFFWYRRSFAARNLKKIYVGNGDDNVYSIDTLDGPISSEASGNKHGAGSKDVVQEHHVLEDF